MCVFLASVAKFLLLIVYELSYVPVSSALNLWMSIFIRPVEAALGTALLFNIICLTLGGQNVDAVGQARLKIAR